MAGSGIWGWIDGVGLGARFQSPVGVPVDSNGAVYVVEMQGRVRKVSSSGISTQLVTTFR